MEKLFVSQLERTPFAMDISEEYAKAERAAKYVRASASEIRDFSIGIVKYQEIRDGGYFYFLAGVFLSALINTSPDNDFLVVTRHLESRLRYLCYMNTKNVTVQGDIDLFELYPMPKGSLTVDGNIRITYLLFSETDVPLQMMPPSFYLSSGRITSCKFAVKGSVMINVPGSDIISKTV
jgi:hypothetical protein